MRTYQNQVEKIRSNDLTKQQLLELKLQQHEVMTQLLPYFQIKDEFRKKTQFEITDFHVVDEEESLDMVKQVSLIDDSHFGTLYLSGAFKIYRINGEVLENMKLPFYEGKVIGMSSYEGKLECYTNRNELLNFEIVENENVKVIETETVIISLSEFVAWGQDIISLSPLNVVFLDDLSVSIFNRKTSQKNIFSDEISDSWSAITSDSSSVYIGTQEGVINVYNIDKGIELKQSYELFETSITHLKLLDDDYLIALGEAGQCTIVDLKTFETQEIKGMEGHLYSVIVNNEEALVLSDEGQIYMLEKFFDIWSLNPWVRNASEIVLGTSWQNNYIVQDIDGLWHSLSICKLRDYQSLYSIDLYK